MQGSSTQNELTDPVTLTFEPQNSTTSRASQLPRSFPTPTPSLNTLGSFVFLSYAPESLKNALNDPVILTFDLLILKPYYF